MVVLKPLLLFVALISIVIATALASVVQQPQKVFNLKALYHDARETRILRGPFEAQPYYERILQEFNPTDITTSTRLAANYKSNSKSFELFENACGTITSLDDCTNKLKELKKWLQSDTVQYTSAHIGSLLHSPRPIRAPIHIIPATAGTVVQEHFPFNTSTKQFTACQCLVSLFLLALCVNINDAIEACSSHMIELLKELGLICHCEYDTNLIYALVSITPIDLHEIQNTLYVATDWHPRVLNMIHIHQREQILNGQETEEEAVMYIGPDSLSLIEHWIIHYTTRIQHSYNKNTTTILDLCTGSGIQALVYLMILTNMQPDRTHHAVCVDMNPRALRFCQFSAALNGIPSHSVTLVQGDIVKGIGRMYIQDRKIKSHSEDETHYPIIQLLQTFHPAYDLITANPPFLPVPPNEKSALFRRHGLFSSGGPSGEVVLAAALSMSKSLSNPHGGCTAIVSEFFFRGDNYNIDSIHELVERLLLYWNRSQNDNNIEESRRRLSGSKAILFTNEYPISRQEYSNRRADTINEAQSWQNHMETEHISSCSPGLIFIQNMDISQQTRYSKQRQWIHHIVPKSDMGSIWTPSNTKAIAVTKAMTREIFGW